MAEMILPGTYIEVRAEGLIVPGRVTVGNVGIVGTASKGPVGVPTVLGSYVDARQKFGDYDAWTGGNNNELTLVRALEQVFAHGATTVIAVRAAKDDLSPSAATAATFVLASAAGPAVTLQANSPGTWGNDLEVSVDVADEAAFVDDEKQNGGAAITLKHKKVAKSARNRVQLFVENTGVTRSLKLIYEDTARAPDSSEVKINKTTGALTFATPPGAQDVVTASYMVEAANAVKVTLKRGRNEEIYTVVNGSDLVADINRTTGGSVWVTAKAEANASDLLNKTPMASFGTGTNKAGSDGVVGADYALGLEKLLNEDAHIIVAAGRADDFGDELKAHCELASTDAIRRDRIAVVGSALGASLDSLQGHNLDSDRLIFVAPGIRVTDAPSATEVTLPGAYAAAAVAGLLASFSPHISPTNKTLSVGGLEKKYTNAELTQLLQSRVMALEVRQGFRIVKGITTATFTAFAQITTRRIVDYAKFGVRSAASSYIGRLNNERVRGSLKTSVASFLNEMVNDELLISYDLNVAATREEERQGIVRVTMVLRPVFSIDFIKVTMFLE